MSLIARNVRKVYRNGAKEVRAVDGISLEIEKARSLPYWPFGRRQVDFFTSFGRAG